MEHLLVTMVKLITYIHNVLRGFSIGETVYPMFRSDIPTQKVCISSITHKKVSVTATKSEKVRTYYMSQQLGSEVERQGKANKSTTSPPKHRVSKWSSPSLCPLTEHFIEKPLTKSRPQWKAPCVDLVFINHSRVARSVCVQDSKQ